ncbi:amino acid/amide ABC transporter membrane protein 1, HAAT family (TC 3.A.1.4.-) [Alteromonadaceae bacterium Bs31]|nr:amino acid/amide ABC transporter membrane protein 1, HAAT family (TC 3.A.1.4.-) [Alteromonadaceae bacterium Bs31]
MKIIKSLTIIVLAFSFASFARANNFEQAVQGLLENSNKKKAAAVEQLAKVDDPRSLPTLKAMLDAKLYYKKDDKSLVIITDLEEGATVHNLMSQSDESISDKRAVSKVRINNKLRRLLRSSIAVLELSSGDMAIRLESAKNLAKNPSADMRDVLIIALEKESSSKIAGFLSLSLGLIDLENEDPAVRRKAVDYLSGSVEPQAIGALKALTAKDKDGNYLEQDKELAAYAAKVFKRVDTKMQLFKTSENMLFGLSLGSVLLLAAIGLAITFGVMGVINMAHGEMIMLGAYTTFTVQQLMPELIGASLFVAIPVAFIVAAAVGVLMERLIIRHLYGRPLDTLLATFGVSLILQQAIRQIYGANSVSVISPPWISGLWEVNGALALTYNRIYILLFAMLVLGLLALLLKKTLVGLQMRAVTQNRPMANSMGIRAGWVDAMTFGLGSGIAGIAGVALSQIASVSPNLGQTYIVDSFMVVVFGGVGNIMGTFIGAMTLGVINKFLEPQVGAVIGKIIVLVFIILFIQWRPRGLFALKGRFVED